MAFISVFLIMVSLFCLVVGVLTPSSFSPVLGVRATRKNIVVICSGLFLLSAFVLGITAANAVDQPVSMTIPQPAKQEGDDTLASNFSAETPAISSADRITQLVQRVGDYEVTVWDIRGNLATPNTTSPYEVIVNTGPEDIRDCFDAKNSLYEIMRRLYTNPQVKDDIARVRFTAWGQLKASLGYNDAQGLSWERSGPSNYWKVTLQYKPYEDENGNLAGRTWGVPINRSCI